MSDKRTDKRTKTHACDLIRRSDVADKLTRIINEMEEIFSNIRMKLVDDSVCGLCEYDCDHGIDGYANECPGFEKDDCFKLKDEYRKEWTSTKDLPSAEPERKTGKWEDNYPIIVEFECLRCGNCHALAPKKPFCCFCGAKMEESEE